MNNTRLQRFNTLATGIIAGVALPILIYFILYFAKVRDIQFTLFSSHLVIGNVIPIIISHCVLPNLILFFIFNGLNILQASKGILGATVVITVLIFALKLFFTVL